MVLFTSRIQKLQDIIGTDAGGRGMKHLIVQDDLLKAARVFATLPPNACILVLSGFPCCVDQIPPTETDGPPGAFAMARTGLALGHNNKVVVVTDDCNKSVFAAASQGIDGVVLETFPPEFSSDDEVRFQKLVSACNLLTACERAGPGANGDCLTMRAKSMKGLVAPLHRFVDDRKNDTPFLAVGDGGNELGMGKVYDAIKAHIPMGDETGCVVAADFLIAASVSNWGGYALAAAAALAKAETELSADASESELEAMIKKYVEKCLPSEQEEIDLLNRCVAAGCRDGVSGKMEATVDGMPLERSLQCLRDIRSAALGLS